METNKTVYVSIDELLDSFNGTENIKREITQWFCAYAASEDFVMHDESDRAGITFRFTQLLEYFTGITSK